MPGFHANAPRPTAYLLNSDLVTTSTAPPPSAGRFNDGRILVDPLKRRGPATLHSGRGGGLRLPASAGARGRRHAAPGLHGAHELPHQLPIRVAVAAGTEDPDVGRPTPALLGLAAASSLSRPLIPRT